MTKQYVACVARIQSGKDVFCEMVSELVAPDTVELIRFSDPLGSSLKRMKSEMPGCADIVLDREHYQKYSTNLREEFDPDILANWVFRKAIASEASQVLIMGMRKMLDVPLMRQLPDCTIVGIQAPRKLRHEWICRKVLKKGEKTPTWEEFLAQDDQECEVDIDRIMEQADFTIYNDKDDPTFAHMRKQAQSFVEMLRG